MSIADIEFPDEEWATGSAAEMGMAFPEWPDWLAGQNPTGTELLGEDPNRPWGAALTRAGRLIRTWGQADVARQSASVGKAFMKLALLIALDEGLIESLDDLVGEYWTGEGELDGAHKYLDNAAHAHVTFNSLWRHEAGFPVTNGQTWRDRQDVPEWAVWTGDPDHDNYAHDLGTGTSYSSGGYWRLSQALTAIHGRSLKHVLDDAVTTPLGIPPERWDWLPGQTIRETRDFYPGSIGYGDFIDEPYDVGGAPVVGGGGWAVMSALDLARVGLLVATRGVWGDQRLLSDHELLDGHAGGNDSMLRGEGGGLMVAWGQVATAGLDFPPSDVFGPFHG